MTDSKARRPTVEGQAETSISLSVLFLFLQWSFRQSFKYDTTDGMANHPMTNGTDLHPPDWLITLCLLLQQDLWHIFYVGT